MALRKITLAVLAGLSGISVACGGTSGSGAGAGAGATAGGPDGSAKPVCDPNDPNIPCVIGQTEPCENFHTDYLGDKLCMKPPTNGYQLHVGPKNYDDPTEVEKWILPAGGLPGVGPDYNWCYYMKTPNDHDIFTSGYVAHMRPGSHHYIMFGLAAGTDVPDSDRPSSCGSRNAQIGGGANFLSGATREVQTATMFGDAPEDAGLGSPMPAHSQVNMNLHFVNITDKPVLQEIWVNMFEKAAGEVTDVVKAMEWLGGFKMNIAPKEHVVLQGTASSCAAPLDVTRILGVTAHMHANTQRVSMYHQPASGPEELIFDDFNWEEPTVWRFNGTIKNPAPDRASGISGAPKNGIFNVTPADHFRWECEVDNKTDVYLNFSDKAYSGEMCNVFGMYSSPKAAKPWLCAF
jgi:hypothetical protein